VVVVGEDDLLLGLQGTSNSREREQGDVAHGVETNRRIAEASEATSTPGLEKGWSRARWCGVPHSPTFVESAEALRRGRSAA
jgi:hypothetical protein